MSVTESPQWMRRGIASKDSGGLIGGLHGFWSCIPGSLRRRCNTVGYSQVAHDQGAPTLGYVCAGEVLRGPSAAPLPRYQARINHGMIELRGDGQHSLPAGKGVAK
jgi:hypothetical protein